MFGVSPGGVAENGTRSGKRSFDFDFMRLVFPNLLPCLPSLAMGLVPTGHHYYEGSESSAERILGLHAAEASLLIAIELPNIPSPTTLLPFHSPQFDTLPGSVTVRVVSPTVRSRRTDFLVICGPMREIRGSRVARTLPDRLGRIEFTFVTDCSFASGCSPPFLLKTQLPSATRR